MGDVFAVNWRLWVLTNVTPPGLQEPLQGYVIAGKLAAAGAAVSYLVVDQQGRIRPVWVSEGDVVRAEVLKDALESSRGLLRR